MAQITGTGTIYSVKRDAVTDCVWAPLFLIDVADNQSLVVYSETFSTDVTSNNQVDYYLLDYNHSGTYKWYKTFLAKPGVSITFNYGPGLLVSPVYTRSAMFNGAWCPTDPNCCPISLTYDITYDLFTSGAEPQDIYTWWGFNTYALDTSGAAQVLVPGDGTHVFEIHGAYFYRTNVGDLKIEVQGTVLYDGPFSVLNNDDVVRYYSPPVVGADPALDIVSYDVGGTGGYIFFFAWGNFRDPITGASAPAFYASAPHRVYSLIGYGGCCG